MDINILYCIDFPAKSENVDKTDKIVGWLLCSCKILELKISDYCNHNYSLEYGLSRPDVAESFKEFPDNIASGFNIIADNKLIDRNKTFVLEAEVEITNDESKKISIVLDLSTNTIQDFDVEDNNRLSVNNWNKLEKEYFNNLKKHPWITIRMDITNKCNLRCIMCHYKEKEYYSKPTNAITAEKLKIQLQDIAPYVKNIMISCGYEPLMSKHFYDIIKMLNTNFPHMEIGLCTNGMLLDSKARKVIIENKVTHVLLSFDGVTKKTLENIRIGADYEKIISNIKALRDLKRKYNKTFPLLYMDFVLMNSNIHEAPIFIRMCKELGIEMIDFRHMVGNTFFKEHEEMMIFQKERYNYYRLRIIEESKKIKINIRLPEPYETDKEYLPEDQSKVDLTDFYNIIPDFQTEEVINTGDFCNKNGDDSDFKFLSDANCLRPFNEIMIHEQDKIMPCSYYGGIMGNIDEDNTLYSIFFNEKYRKVRRKKMQSSFDFNCVACPIKSNLLPTDIVK